MNKKESIEDIILESELSILLLSNDRGSGTGFVVSSEGHIITCNHVVDSNEIKVLSPNGETWKLPVLARDASFDLAMLKIEKPNLPCMVFADPSSIFSGQNIYALGHPLGLSFTVSQGIISSQNRIIKGVGYVQTDVAINPGNSGGPIINEKGEVIGVTNKMISLKIAQGIGFATEIRHVFSFAAKLRIDLKRVTV